MIRYIKLYLYCLRFSFSKAMEFRIDFFFRIFMDILFYFINFLFYFVIFKHTQILGGWTIDQIFIFVSSFLVIDAINMTVFANNLWYLPEFIVRGDLDYYLVRPVSSLFMLSVRDFAANSFINLIIAFSLLIWAIIRYPSNLSLFSIVIFFLLIITGAILRYFVRMMFIIPTFWLHSNRGFEMIFFQMNRFIERPDRIYTGFMRIILTTVLPFGVMASFPTRFLVDDFNLNILFHFITITIIFFLFIKWFWQKGLKGYSSASS